MLNLNGKKLIIFGGKGGTGKTTCSAATALGLAEKRDLKVLVVSIDPAHSLGDCFEAEIQEEPTRIDGVGGLHAVELNGEKLIEDYRESYGGYLEELLERGTYLDSSDISSLLDLPLPGFDEVTAVLKLNDYYREKKYDTIILDTPPTGHLYSLLDLPGEMVRWLEFFELLAEKHRYIKSSLVGDYPEDEIDDFLKSRKEELEFTRDLLFDGTRTEFLPVLLPGKLPFRETRRLFQDTELAEITSTVIFNKVQHGRDCDVCKAERAAAKKHLKRFSRDLPGLNIIPVRKFTKPVTGIPDLGKVADDLLEAQPDGFFHPTKRETESKSNNPAHLPKHIAATTIDTGSDYLLFGGKGGVGKTTAAVATGLNLVRRLDESVLVMSIDPAGSLNDLFSEEIGRRPTGLDTGGKGELHAIETKPEEELADLRETYRGAIEEGFTGYTKSSGVSLEYDEKILSRLFTLIPPGVNEIMALVNLIELADEKSYDRVIIDTAPTGHLVRFLQLPDTASGWLETALKISLKYRKLIDGREITNRIASMARKVRKVRELLLSGEESRAALVVVTVPEIMIIRETNRLTRQARAAGFQNIDLLVNMVLRGDLCDSCYRERKDQEKRIRELVRENSGGNIATAPYLSQEPDSEEKLLEFSEYFISPEPGDSPP